MYADLKRNLKKQRIKSLYDNKLETEENFRKVVETVDGIGRCILFIDEIEKSLSRDAVSGKGDTGTSSRSFATLLTWLSEHKSPVFVIGTSNDHTKLPTEFTRKGRFDELNQNGSWQRDLPVKFCYMLETPSILMYVFWCVKIINCGQSAGKSLEDPSTTTRRTPIVLDRYIYPK